MGATKLKLHLLACLGLLACSAAAQGEEWLEIGGYADLDSVSTPPENQGEYTHIGISEVGLSLAAVISDWAGGEAGFLYEHTDLGERENVAGSEAAFLETATLRVGPPEGPCSLVAGRQFLPFGVFDTRMISDPLTLEVAETNEISVSLRWSSGALEQADAGEKNLAVVLEACADYLVNSMGRLDLTDMNIHNLLKERIPQDNAEVHEALETLANRQALARAKTAALDQALKNYRRGDRADFAAFGQALRNFHQAVSELMTPRKNPFSTYTDELFTMDDWTAIAEASAETMAAEDRLYDAVRAAAPDSLKPDNFSGTPGLRA